MFEKTSVTQARKTRVTENSVVHRMIGKIRHQQRSGRSIYVNDGIFRHPDVSGLRHSWFF
jgi:hypothetical protein